MTVFSFRKNKDQSSPPPEEPISASNRSMSDSGGRIVKIMPEHVVFPEYSVKELVEALGHERDIHEFPPELQRRVRDFHLAQRKRREKFGEQKRWGIFGMYSHLANCRIDLEWAEDSAYRRQNELPYLAWADFNEEHKRGKKQIWFVYSVIILCSIMMLVEFGVNGWNAEPLNVNPLIGPSAETLIKVGARDTNRIQDGQWFRIFSPIILHAGVIHFLINMIAFWYIGGAIEKTHGIYHSIILFLIPGVGGNILSAIFLPQYISVGASGGIFGLIGGCLADISLNWNILFIKDHEEDQRTWKRNALGIFWLFLDILVNILLGLTPFIDNFTHMGGLVYGLLCGWTTIDPLAFEFLGASSEKMSKIRTLFVRFFGLFTSLLLIIVTTIVLATKDVTSSPCNGCRYISCVPFPWWSEDKWWECDDCEFVTARLFRTEGDDLIYDQIDLTCPDGTVESINISQDGLTSVPEVQDGLPSYCRNYCDEIFS